MAFYKIVQGTPAQRDEIRNRLPGLNELSPEVREKVITAWVTAWQNGSYENLNDIPFALQHRLMDHVAEVVRFGMSFAKAALEEWGEQWGKQLDWQELIQALILHDLDKPMLYAKSDKPLEKFTITPCAMQIPHGILGSLILNELGFSDNVVSAVATHSLESPFHPATILSYILHYADLFSADHARLEEGIGAFYQKHYR
jgi:HD superfamily phosphohydrolase YqeK